VVVYCRRGGGGDGGERGAAPTRGNRATGATVRYTLTEGFVQRFRDTPRPQLDAQGRTVLDLPESEVLQPAPDAR
jgi:hypothetical protein